MGHGHRVRPGSNRPCGVPVYSRSGRHPPRFIRPSILRGQDVERLPGLEPRHPAEGRRKELDSHHENGIVTRGVLYDIPRLKGVPYLEPGTRIFPADLEAWE